MAEKKRRHVYQNVNGGVGGAGTTPAPMDDSSDSENYAKVLLLWLGLVVVFTAAAFVAARAVGGGGGTECD